MNKCQRCPKQATLHITEVLGEDRFEEVHLCEECAKKYLYEPQQKKAAKAADPLGAAEEDPEGLGDKQCEACGIKFVEFRNHGRLGCPHDYDAFRVGLEPLLRRIHRATRHVGKTPRQGASPRRAAELVELRRQLQAAVDAERYEEAARVRDLLRQKEATDESG